MSHSRRYETMRIVLGGRSIRLAHVFGVRIGVDPSWFIVLFLIIWSLSGAFDEVFPGEGAKSFALATAAALLFFASVVLHELGHALVAIRNGIGIAGIDLWLFGGIAKMSRDTDSPGVELRIALAGPVVTLAIVLLCAGATVLLAGPKELLDAMALRSGSAPGALAVVLGYLALVNALLLVFNLIPGFPLDGGRIARAIAWWSTGDRNRATRFAAGLGRAFAYVFIGFGVFMLLQGFLVGGVWLALIGMFLAQAARSSALQSKVQSQLEGIRVADVMDAQPVAVPASASLERAFDEFFLRYRWPWFPVVDPQGRFVGLLTRDSVEEVPEDQRAMRAVEQTMARDAGGSLRASPDESLEALLAVHRDGLYRLGAVMAVDGEGVLRGIVTLDQVRRALRAATPAI